MLTDEELLAIANKARRCLQVGTILSDFPVGRCKITSIFLMRWLGDSSSTREHEWHPRHTPRPCVP